MCMLYEIDVNYVEKCEKIVIIKSQEFFNNKPIKWSHFDNSDFYDEKEEMYIELKSSRCKIDSFDLTIVGMNKKHGKNITSQKQIWLFFLLFYYYWLQWSWFILLEI